MKETLQITLRKNRRTEDLVQVARKIQGEKIASSYAQSQKTTYEKDGFTESEQFEISWFDDMVKFFLEHMDTNATDLERYRLFLPEKLYKAMFELHQKCKQYKIDYRPMDSILKSIINKIKVTEQKLKEKSGITSNILEKIQFAEMQDAVSDMDGTIMEIFKLLIECPDFYNTFNHLATSDYNKQSNIKPVHFKGYAKAHKRPSRWVCACALDVIAGHKNLFNLVSPDALMELWIKPKLRSGSNVQSLISKLKNMNASTAFIENVSTIEKSPL